MELQILGMTTLHVHSASRRHTLKTFTLLSVPILSSGSGCVDGGVGACMHPEKGSTSVYASTVCLCTYVGGGDKLSSSSTRWMRSLGLEGLTFKRSVNAWVVREQVRGQGSCCCRACCSFRRYMAYFCSTVFTRSASSFSKIVRKFCSSGTENLCHCKKRENRLLHYCKNIFQY